MGRIDLNAPSWNPRIPNIVVSTTGVFAQGSVRFVYSVIVAAAMSAAVLGELNALISLALLASMLWPTSAGFAATKYVALARGSGRPERAAGVIALLRVRVLITSVALGCAVGVLAMVVVDATLSQGLLTLALVVAYSMYTLVRGVVYGLQQIPRATLWDAVSALVALTGLAAVVMANKPAALLVPLTVGYAGYAFVNWPRTGDASLPEEARREIDRFVAYGVVGVLASAGLPLVAMVVAKVSTGATHAGQLAAALSLATPCAMLASAAILVMSPALAQMVGREDHALARHHTDLATRGLVGVMVGVFGSLILISPLLVTVFYPGEFNEAADLLPILLVAVLVTTIAAAPTTHLLVARPYGQRIFAGINVLGFVLGITAMWAFLASHQDTRSIALGYVVGAVVVGLAPIVVVWRTDRHRWTGTALRAVAGGALIWLGYVVEEHRGTSVLTQVLLVVGFLALWLLLSRNELKAALHELTGRAPVRTSPPLGPDVPSNGARRT
jgi:putative peptidoglycan lipid II flippase